MYIRPKTHSPFPHFAPCLKAGKVSFLTEIPTLTCNHDHLVKLPEASVNYNKRYPARNLQQTNNIHNAFACSDRCSTLKIELCFILVWPMTYATFFCQPASYSLFSYEVVIFQHYIEFHAIGYCAASINYPAKD
jgi:hypothetical protein